MKRKYWLYSALLLSTICGFSVMGAQAAEKESSTTPIQIGKKEKMDDQWLTVSQKGILYQDKQGEQKKNLVSGQVYLTNGYYTTKSGERYYSLYVKNKSNKNYWVGYANATQLKKLVWKKEVKKVTFTKEKKLYRDLSQQQAKNKGKGTVVETRGYYLLGNKQKLYSVGRLNAKDKKEWLGYISEENLQKLTLTKKKEEKYIAKKDRPFYRQLFLTKETGTTTPYVGKAIDTKGYYTLGNGKRYYSCYQNKKWLGYLSEKDLESLYYTKNPKIVRTKQTIALYKDKNRTKKAQTIHANDFLKVNECITLKGKAPILKVNDKYYTSANKLCVAKSKGYQNPSQYYQVQYQQIKPCGTVGYNLGWGYMGVKSYLVMKKLGVYTGYNFMGNAQINAVKNYQRTHGLKVTGWVDEKMWTKLGYSAKSWKEIDAYVAPLQAHAWDNRQKHIEAMIQQAYKYLGNKYLEGASSSPKYGVDCSGLVMQALYAGGIDPAPISSIHHAFPGNEYNSRNLWASPKLKRVPYQDRQRGDLIFYYQPGTQTIWHVAIYLGNDKVIESWPPKVVVWPIRNAQRNVIAGVKRPFL